MENDLYKDMLDLTEILKTIKFPIVMGNVVGIVDLSKADCVGIAKRICMEGFRRKRRPDYDLRLLLEKQEKALGILRQTNEKMKIVFDLKNDLQSTAKKEGIDGTER